MANVLLAAGAFDGWGALEAKLRQLAHTQGARADTGFGRSRQKDLASREEDPKGRMVDFMLEGTNNEDGMFKG